MTSRACSFNQTVYGIINTSGISMEGGKRHWSNDRLYEVREGSPATRSSVRPCLCLAQPYSRRFEPLAALGDIEGDAFTFIQGRQPGSFKAERWTNTSLPPLSRAMKPKPFSVLNHFTVPVSWIARSEDGLPDVGARELDRGGVVGVAVLPSDRMISRCSDINAGRSGAH
jgi:hypothetical protein